MASRRPSRAATGYRVRQSAMHLSDRLMAIEIDTQTEMENRFTARLGDVATVVRAGHKQRRSITGPVGDILLDVATACRPLTLDLLIRSGSMSLDACQVELAAVEKNLGPKYDGIATVTADRQRPLVTPRADDLMDTWAEEMGKALTWVDERIDQVWAIVMLDREPLDVALSRLVSATPLRLKDQQGVGLVWKAFQTAFAAARAQQFVLVNEVRVQMMARFNEIGVGVRDGR